MPTLEAEIGALLGGSSALQGQPDLRAAVQHGLPYAALVALADARAIDDVVMADLLAISERTHQRRKGGTLSPAESDRLARVVSHAERRGSATRGSRAAHRCCWRSLPSSSRARNLLINPTRVGLGTLRIGEPEPLVFDTRLFR